MRRSYGGLPRVRVSFPGSPTKSIPRPAPWAALLLLVGLLVLTGYARIAGHIRLTELKSNRSTSTGSRGTRNAAAGALAGPPGASIEGITSMQQGLDFAGDSTMRMLSTQQQQPDSYISNGLPFLQAQHSIKSPADAMGRHPAVHGHVFKAGMADPMAWLNNHTDDRLDSFLSWRLDRTRAGGLGPANEGSYTCAAADHPPLPYPGCHVFVNHEYKYVYIRSPKSASTSIVNVLGECDNKRTRGFNSSSCMALHFYWPKSVLQMENLQQMWKDYFVFGFVRNPWRRAYSLYKYIHSNGCMDSAQLKDPRCRVPWSQFCSDPWRAAEELHDRGCIMRSKSYLYFHMADQFHCMRTAHGDWAVDFIGRVDQPNDDWAEVIKTLNARRSPAVPELPISDLEQQNVRQGSGKDPYDASHMQCFDSVSRWYACDIEHYGFAGAKQT